MGKLDLYLCVAARGDGGHLRDPLALSQRAVPAGAVMGSDVLLLTDIFLTMSLLGKRRVSERVEIHSCVGSEPARMFRIVESPNGLG